MGSSTAVQLQPQAGTLSSASTSPLASASASASASLSGWTLPSRLTSRIVDSPEHDFAHTHTHAHAHAQSYEHYNHGRASLAPAPTLITKTGSEQGPVPAATATATATDPARMGIWLCLMHPTRAHLHPTLIALHKHRLAAHGIPLPEDLAAEPEARPVSTLAPASALGSASAAASASASEPASIEPEGKGDGADAGAGAGLPSIDVVNVDMDGSESPHRDTGTLGSEGDPANGRRAQGAVPGPDHGRLDKVEGGANVRAAEEGVRDTDPKAEWLCWRFSPEEEARRRAFLPLS